jgi:hypothetical protein
MKNIFFFEPCKEYTYGFSCVALLYDWIIYWAYILAAIEAYAVGQATNFGRTGEFPLAYSTMCNALSWFTVINFY